MIFRTIHSRMKRISRIVCTPLHTPIKLLTLIRLVRSKFLCDTHFAPFPQVENDMMCRTE